MERPLTDARWVPSLRLQLVLLVPLQGHAYGGLRGVPSEARVKPEPFDMAWSRQDGSRNRLCGHRADPPGQPRRCTGRCWSQTHTKHWAGRSKPWVGEADGRGPGDAETVGKKTRQRDDATCRWSLWRCKFIVKRVYMVSSSVWVVEVEWPVVVAPCGLQWPVAMLSLRHRDAWSFLTVWSSERLPVSLRCLRWECKPLMSGLVDAQSSIAALLCAPVVKRVSPASSAESCFTRGAYKI